MTNQKNLKIYYYHHTHWDREWYKPFESFRIRFARVMESLILELEAGNLRQFYLDGQTVVLEDYFEVYPEKREVIKKFIQEKKLIIGPWYTLADEFLVSGESLIKNLEIGIKQAKELGCEDFIGYLPDSFGHNSEIPSILNRFDIKNAVLWRGVGDTTLQSFCAEFLWKSSGNSEILTTCLTEGYFQNPLHEESSIEQKAEKLKNLIEKLAESASGENILIPLGGDHLGVIPCFCSQISLIEKILKKENPHWEFMDGGIFKYLEAVKNTPNLEIFKGELRDNTKSPVLPGVFSARIYLKRRNSALEWKLSHVAEPLCRLAGEETFFGINVEREFERAWKLLIKNHAHDSICGCSVDEVHEEVMTRFSQAEQICDELISMAKTSISCKITEGSIWVCNLSNSPYSGVIKVKSSAPITENLEKQPISTKKEFPEKILLDTQRPPFAEDMRNFSEYLIYAENLPPMQVVLIAENSKNNDKISIYENRLENSQIALEVQKDGSLELFNKNNNRSFKGLHYILDRADIGDSYNFSPAENDLPIQAKLLKTKIVEKGNLRSILEVYYEMEIPEEFVYENSDSQKGRRSLKTAKTILKTEISLHAGSKRADFKTSWENRSKDHIMQIGFLFEEKITSVISENTFGVIERHFDAEYCMEDHIPAKKGEELKTNTASMQRFVCTNGLGILTKGLYEYEIPQKVTKNTLYITVLRSTGMLSKLFLNTRGFSAGPPLEVSACQCLGLQSVEYSIVPYDSSEEMLRHADEFFGCVVSGIGDTL